TCWSRASGAWRLSCPPDTTAFAGATRAFGPTDRRRPETGHFRHMIESAPATPHGVRHPDDFLKERPLYFSRPWPGLLAALALLMLLLAGPAAAAPSADTETPASAAQLAELLENEESRKALIEQL